MKVKRINEKLESEYVLIVGQNIEIQFQYFNQYFVNKIDFHTLQLYKDGCRVCKIIDEDEQKEFIKQWEDLQ